MDVADLSTLVDSGRLALAADRKSPQTIKSYTDGTAAYLAWCSAEERPPLDRASLRRWVTSLLDAGRTPATARSRQLAVRRFTSWLADEGEIDADPFVGIKPPKIDVPVLEPLTEEQLRDLLRACQAPRGSDDSVVFRARRDEAIIRLMVETASRAGEVVDLAVADVDLTRGTATIRRGKGGRGRVVPYGPQTARALDRYLRVRSRHRLAGRPALWLGDRSKGFTYDALHATLARRAAEAGIEGFHPHLLRHTGAHRWLAAGGSEGGLMAVAGWTRPDMLMRYTRARAADRAAEEARRLNLGDL